MPSYYRILSDHVLLVRMAMQLVVQGRLGAADYLLAIINVDAAEHGLLPEGSGWICPGEPPPPDWHVYQAIMQRCDKSR